MPKHEPLDYRLRCHTKRTDLPPDVLRDIGEAYEYMQLLRDELTERIHMCDMRSEKILELTAERDEARFAAAYQYAKHHNGDVQTLMDNFCELKGWQKIQFFVGDDDHAKERI